MSHLSDLSPKELENLGNEIGRLPAGKISAVLTGVIKTHGLSIATQRLIEATQYFGAVDRGNVASGHKKQME